MTSPQPRIVTGSVYHPPEDPYPRVLVMRRWPRGVAKGAVDQWERDLAPSDALLDAYNRGELEWDVFERRYREEVAREPSVLDWVTGMAMRTGVTLLCGSHPEERCHRCVLAELIRLRSEMPS